MQTSTETKPVRSERAQASLAIIKSYEPTAQDLAEANEVHTDMQAKFFSELVIGVVPF